MNKVVASLVAVVVCCLLSVGFLSFADVSTVSAQSAVKQFGDGRIDQKDKDMAAEIKRRTNREADFLSQKYQANGVFLDLDGGYQNVALARSENDGGVTSACITSLAEANSFFGRDLETGERIQRTPTSSRPTAKAASDHGMSEAEFIFYTNLIEEARQYRLASPNAATINIVNNDGGGEGFNDATAAFANPEGGNTGATKGEQRLNVFNFAAAIWGAFLDTNVAINVNSQFNPQTCSTGSAVLGSAGSNGGVRDFPGAQLTNTWYHMALANKQAGTDLFPADHDINATFNLSIDSSCFLPGHRWYYGLDNATPASRTNLLVVLLHEMGHGLGFSTFANGSTGALAGGFPDVWSRYMFDNTTGLFWNSPAMTNGQRQASAISNGGLRWDGPSVKLASSFLTVGRDAATGRVQLHAPPAFQPGSSVSHFTSDASPNLLMEPSINSGLAIDGDLARQLMRDIGWFRDSTADVSADTITNVTPNGGQAVINSSRTISWTNNGGFSRNVRIELSTDGGVTWPLVVASSVANTGSFSWTVPNNPSTTARIRVREADFAEPSGSSSANFTITSAPLAGGATIAGRVVDANGRAVKQATVVLTDADGAARIALSNSFGYFSFDDVPVGESYIANVRHKRYRFEQRLVNLMDSMTDVDFVVAP